LTSFTGTQTEQRTALRVLQPCRRVLKQACQRDMERRVNPNQIDIALAQKRQDILEAAWSMLGLHKRKPCNARSVNWKILPLLTDVIVGMIFFASGWMFRFVRLRQPLVTIAPSYHLQFKSALDRAALVPSVATQSGDHSLCTRR